MAGDPPFLSIRWNDKADLTGVARSVTIEDDDRLIDKATVVIADPQRSAPEFRGDQTLEITMGWSAQHAMMFSGIVQSASGTNAADGTSTITIVAYDPSVLMHREPCDATYTGTLSSVVRTVAGRHPTIPIRDVVCDPDPNFTGTPQLIQHNLTDLQFLQWLAWRYGHRAFVEVNDGRPQFSFVSNQRLMQGDVMGTLQWCRGLRQLTEFRYEKVAARAARQRIAATPDPATGTDTPTQGATPAPIDPPIASPDRAAALGAADPALRTRYEAGVQAAQANPAPAPTPAPVVGLPSDPHLATAVTALDPTQVLGLRGTGTAVGTVMLRAKGKVRIEGVAPWAEGEWYVRKAVHTWRDTSSRRARSASYQTSFTVTK